MEHGAAHGRPERRALVALAVAGAALLALSPLMLHFLVALRYEHFVLAALAQGAVYAFAVWLILRCRFGRAALGLIFAIAVIARAIALPAPPTLSTDIARYVWDGRVQAAGINPYRYVPADERLAALRDDAIYPNINRADYAPTVYPPAAEMIFLAVTRLSETLTAMRLAMIGFEAVTALALLAARERRALAGLALAAGALTKPFVLLVAPALWRRWDWRLPAALIAAGIVFYLPYLGAGSGVLGYLGGYGEEQGYADGSGFFLVALLRALGLPAPGG